MDVRYREKSWATIVFEDEEGGVHLPSWWPGPPLLIAISHCPVRLLLPLVDILYMSLHHHNQHNKIIKHYEHLNCNNYQLR